MSVPPGISARVTELNAEVERLREERDQLEAALFECAKLSGADVSDGPPGWPDIATWAVEEVGQARRDCDEGADEDRAVRARVAELEMALREIDRAYREGATKGWLGIPDWSMVAITMVQRAREALAAGVGGSR